MRAIFPILLILSLAIPAGAIMPANWQTWQNYSLALFYDDANPMIQINHPDVVDENGTIIQEAWTELVPAVIDVQGIAQVHGWRTASAYYVTVDPKLNDT